MDFRTIIITSLLVGLFIVSMFSFISILSTENEVTDITSNPSVNKAFGNLSAKLNDSTTMAEAQKKSLESESANPIITSIGFFFGSILNAGSIFMEYGIGVITIVFVFSEETLGIPPIILGVLSAILTITLILAVWRVFRAGE